MTPAHAAAAWPIRRAWPALPLVPLVAGTLSPDFEYFLHLAPRGDTSHTLAGIFLICLPGAAAAWLLFDTLARPALLGLLPPGLRNTLVPRRESILLGLVAILAGAFSHVLWDGFTHEDRWAAAYLPGLRNDVAPEWLPGIRWFKLLQHGSSLVGAVAVAMWIRGWLRQQPAVDRVYPPGEAARAARTVAILAAAALACGAANGAVASGDLPTAMGRVAVGGMAGLALAVAVFALLRRLARS